MWQSRNVVVQKNVTISKLNLSAVCKEENKRKSKNEELLENFKIK